MKPTHDSPALEFRDVAKTFTLHLRGGVHCR